MGVAEGWGGCQLEAHPSEGWKRGPGPGSHSHISVSFLVQGERGVPGRKGVKGQKGEPGPPGLDQPCPVVRVGTVGAPTQVFTTSGRALAGVFSVLRAPLQVPETTMSCPCHQGASPCSGPDSPPWAWLRGTHTAPQRWRLVPGAESLPSSPTLFSQLPWP